METTTNPAIPTNKELVSFIEKIFEFLTKIVELFKKLADGLEIGFAGYKPVDFDEILGTK